MDFVMELADFVAQGSFTTSAIQQYRTQDNQLPELLNGIRTSHMQGTRRELGWEGIYQRMKPIR